MEIVCSSSSSSSSSRKKKLQREKKEDNNISGENHRNKYLFPFETVFFFLTNYIFCWYFCAV